MNAINRYVGRECKIVYREPERFAVYAGDGVYLSDLAIGQGCGFVHLSGLSNCASLARAEAVAACHAMRRAGVPAWIVRNPENALA